MSVCVDGEFYRVVVGVVTGFINEKGNEESIDILYTDQMTINKTNSEQSARVSDVSEDFCRCPGARASERLV